MMIIDDYESIATAHARIFAPKAPEVLIPPAPPAEDDKYSIAGMTEEEINNLLAAICELIA